LGIPSDNPDVLNVEVVLSGTGTLGICLIEQIYGYESEEVKHLRSFRDKVLCSTPGGQEIIKLYYAYSPLLVEAMEADGAFKQEMRGLIDMSLLLIRGKVD